MKCIIGTTYGAYSFNAATKQVTFSELYEAVDIKNILEITNITRNKIIYLAENPATGGTLSGNVLTLTFDTTSYSNSDDLRIIYDYSIVKEKTLSTINNPSISIPSTVYQVTISGQTVSAQIDAGGTYAFCIQQPDTTVALISAGGCTTTLSSTSVAVPLTTGLAIGQQVVGTGIPYGATISAIVPNTSITLTIPATASGTNSILFTGGNFQVNFECSTNNSTWTPVTGVPKTIQSLTTPVSAVYSPGLWIVEADPDHKFLRMNVVNLTSIPKLNLWIDSLNQNSSGINIPYISGLTAAIPTGLAFIPPIDVSGLSEFNLDLSAFSGTSQTITWKQTSDPLLLATAQGLAHVTNSAAQNSAAITLTSTGNYRIAPSAKYFFAALTHTAITAMTVTGIRANVGNQPTIIPVHITSNNTPINISQVGGQTPITLQPGGSTNRAMVNAIGGPVTLTAYSAQAWAAAAGSGATIADTNGLGNTYSFDISVTVWTAGLSTGLVVSVEESTDGGTTWVKIYTAEPITSVSHTKIPALQINGRCRMTWINLNGAATTATVTVTATGISRSVEKMYKFYDRTAGVGFNTSVVSTVTPAYGIVGTNNTVISVVALSGSGATFLPQFSIDGTNFFDGATTGTAIGSGAVTKQIAVDTTANGPFVRVKCISGGSFISQIGIYSVN